MIKTDKKKPVFDKHFVVNYKYNFNKRISKKQLNRIFCFLQIDKRRTVTFMFHEHLIKVKSNFF